MTTITEIDGVEICKHCGHECHCDYVECNACTQDGDEDPICTTCEHG
jgi:hypothetical protein